MSSGMYMIDSAGRLLPLVPTPFPQEADFQKLLKDHPELLTGDQVEPSSPRRWLLVQSEVGVPTGAELASSLSLDVLYLDQDGVPTLVEIKRASDTRLRREVVAQMLDYAANAVVYWPPENLRSRFEERSMAIGRAPAQEIIRLLGIQESEIDEYWQKVASNLRGGRIRMLFVADIIPPELKRIVEFLNEQMSPAVVLGLELRQYSGGGVTALGTAR